MKVILLLLLLSLSSCFYSGMDDDYQSIDSELRPYVNTFVLEAQERGITVDISRLKLHFGDLNGEAEGRCNHNTHQVLIDSGHWGKTQGKEELIFHELGHLYLHRDHEESKIGRYYKSIMAGVGDGNYERKDRTYQRPYYLDELFNPETKRPEWSY